MASDVMLTWPKVSTMIHDTNLGATDLGIDQGISKRN